MTPPSAAFRILKAYLLAKVGYEQGNELANMRLRQMTAWAVMKKVSCVDVVDVSQVVVLLAEISNATLVVSCTYGK